MVLGGCSCGEDLQDNEPSALNFSVECLKLIRKSIGSQCKCRGSAVVDLKGNEEF